MAFPQHNPLKKKKKLRGVPLGHAKFHINFVFSFYVFVSSQCPSKKNALRRSWALWQCTICWILLTALGQKGKFAHNIFVHYYDFNIVNLIYTNVFLFTCPSPMCSLCRFMILRAVRSF